MNSMLNDVIDKLDEWAEVRGAGMWTCNELGQTMLRRTFIEELVTEAAENYAHDLSDEAYEQGHEDGYDEGYNTGHDEGYSEGYVDASNVYEK